VYRKSNLIIFQQDATYSVYYSQYTGPHCWYPTNNSSYTHQYNGTLITEQNRGEQNPLFLLAIDTGPTSQLFHNKWIPTVRYTWISSNSTTRADGSRSGYGKTILLISIVLLPKYLIITKSGIHTIVLTGSDVYWTVHHCDSWRIKDQLDVTCYFISLLMCSTCFGH